MKLFFILIAISTASIPLIAVPIKPPLDFYKDLPVLDGHPGHAPLISEATFRAISDHIIDQSTDWFDPDLVLPGDTIYLNIWYLPWFEKQVHDQIKHPYILITCDVGAWIPDPITIKKLLYDPKVAAWFGRNFLFSYHPKLFQIPIGHYVYACTPLFNAQTYFLSEYALNKPFPKHHLLYMNHLPRPLADRDKIVLLFEDKPYCLSRNHSNEVYTQIDRKTFFEEIATSKFVISPLGCETDCLRTWEAVTLGSIPIIEHSFLDPLYENLPILLVHDWKEINEELLKEKYIELKDISCEKACFDYWHNLIKAAQNKIRTNDLSSSQLEATLFNTEDLENLLTILETRGGPLNKILCYKGLLSTLRPFQLVNAAPFLSKVYMYDPWLSLDALKDWGKYLKEPSILRNKNKFAFLFGQNQFDSLCSPKGCPIFLDLTYYRNSLLKDFGNLRHRLKQDLIDLYRQTKVGTLICGNMSEDLYVKESLDYFSKETDLCVEKKGNFWFLIRE